MLIVVHPVLSGQLQSTVGRVAVLGQFTQLAISNRPKRNIKHVHNYMEMYSSLFCKPCFPLRLLVTKGVKPATRVFHLPQVKSQTVYLTCCS